MKEGLFIHSYSPERRPDLHKNRRRAQLLLAVLFNLALVVMELIAIVALWRSHPVFKDQVIFYTNLSNFLTLLGSAAFVLVGGFELFRKARIPHGLKVFRFICTLQLYITFIVILAGFVPMVLSGNAGAFAAMYGGSMFVMHLLAPLVSLVSFVFLEGTPRLTLMDTVWAVVPTYLYTVVMVPLNAAGVVEGPYPFLQVDVNPWYVTLLYAVTLLPADYLVSLIGKWLNNGIACRIAGETKE